jgi:NADPH:quinone reductase-like Zn-dependent oxidoreductase
MKMKASRIHRFGPPDVIALEEIERPVPGEGEVLVRVKAAGVGPWDALIRTGTSGLPQPLPLTLGSDLSGSVEAIGGGQPTFEPGEEVFGVTNARFTDAYAEYAIASANMIARKPRTINDVEAASVPVIAVTAWQMLFDRAQLTAGQTVLVHGGAGNVGAYAVQLAHHEHARVIATASAADAAFVRGLGADQVIDFHAARFEDDAGPVDVVIDTVGGDTQRRSFAVLKPGGMLVSVVSQPDAQEAARRNVRTSYFIVDVTSRQLAQIASLIDAGQLTTSVGTVLPLADAQRAHEMLAGTVPHARGKIVLNVAA